MVSDSRASSPLLMSYSSSPTRAPVASAVLAKFEHLNTRNKKLECDNAELRCRLKACTTNHNSPIRRWLSEDNGGEDTDLQADASFELFCKRLIAMGVDIKGSAAKQQALEELFMSVQRQEVEISNKGVRLLQQYSIVRVYLLANIAGSERCLIEHDRLDLRSGKQKTLMIPLEIRMREGEGWRQAARRGLQMMVGLPPEWQEDYIIFDENSHICNNESVSGSDGNPLDSLLSVAVHEVHAKLKGSRDTPAKDLGLVRQTSAQSQFGEGGLLAQIGLPSGRDFVYCEDSHTTVHVWCWKSREYERNGRMKAFEKYLADHGVDTSKLGVGNNKTLFKFYAEVKEEKQCSLHEEKAGTQTDDKKLLRVVRILKIKVMAQVNKRKRVLMESERYDADGRKRAGGQLIIRKLREEDDWQAEVPCAIADRLGISLELLSECFYVDHAKMTYVEETVASKGFAGIMSNYKITVVPVYVITPDHEDLDCIGLPRGNDFVSKEFTHSDQPNLHVWSWVPVGDEDESRAFAGTALEVTNRDLYDVEHILTQTIASPEIQALGLDRAFKTPLQKLKHCAELLQNIDKTIATVDVSSIMGTDVIAEEGSQGGSNSSSALKSFIESNFVRGGSAQAQAVEKEQRRRMSFMDAELDAADIQGFSLEQLFSNADPLSRSIMECRNDWNLDFFDLQDQCDGGTHLLEVYGEVMLAPFFVLAFDSAEETACDFVVAASAHYLDNPYHGPIHAAQVCHLSRWLTKAMKVMDNQPELETTAFMIAAFCHDIKHIGRNNNFCVTSEHPLALLFNNASVLENYHSSSCLELLESTQVLKHLELKDRQRVRSHIIENILATDMAEHFETISKFRVRRESSECTPEVEEDRRFLAKLCLKAGDLGHACLPWNLHVQWSTQMTQEFFAQGDEEKRLGLPVSALCDRKEMNNLGKSQRGFLDFVVSPLFTVMSESQPAPKPPKLSKDDRKMSTATKRLSVKRRVSSCPPMAASLNIEQACIQVLRHNVIQWQENTEVVAQIATKIGAVEEELHPSPLLAPVQTPVGAVEEQMQHSPFVSENGEEKQTGSKA